MSDRKLADDADYQLALKTRESLADPNRWCRGTRAEQNNISIVTRGDRYRPDYPILHCMAGHLELAMGVTEWHVREYLAEKRHRIEPTIDRIAHKMGFNGVSGMMGFNDIAVDHREVLTRWDKGLEKMREDLMSPIKVTI